MIKINRTGLFLQVRLNSTRMPGKALLNLSGKTLIAHVMDRLTVVPADVRAIVTSPESAEVLRPIAERSGWDLFVGPSQNVLKRYVDAAQFYDVNVVIRATGDNPLSSSEIAIQTLTLFHKTNADLAYLAPVPYGSGVEVVKTSALETALANTVVPYDLEHVTPFLYKNPSEFKIVTEKYHNDEAARADVRVTVDTREDYERINYFIKKINTRRMNMTIHSIVNIWDELKFDKYKSALFITAAGTDFGLGHLKRSFFLAQALNDEYNVYFTLKNSNEDALSLIKSNGFTYVEFDEIESFIEANGAFDRVIVDLRDTDLDEMEKYLACGPVFSVDDMGSGGQLAYVNVRTLPSLNEKKYKFNLDGIEYLFIGDAAGERRPAGHSTELKKILITFGGADPALLTNKVVRALTGRGYELTVIAGPFFKEKVNASEDCKVLYAPDSISEYIAEADLVITSFGMTFMEALKNEVPVVLCNPTFYHDALTKEFAYPYYIKKESVDAANKLEDTLPALIATMQKEGVFTGGSASIAQFFHCGIGSKFMNFVKIIKESTPSVNLCASCCSFDVQFVGRNSLWNMYRCNSCGLYYLEYLCDKKVQYDNNYFFKEYKDHYGKTYEEDRTAIRRFAERRLKMIKKYCKSGKMLDFGAGLGFFAEYARENGFDPVCYDVSEYAVNYINDKLGIPAKCADQGELEKSDELFDVIASFYVIEHIREFEKLIFLFTNHLKKGGVLALSTPNGNGVSVRKKFEQYITHHPCDHYFIFNPRMLKKVLVNLGFKNIKIKNTGIHPVRIVNSKKILKNKIGYRLIYLYAKIFRLGDTFEIYAQKS